MVTQGSRVYGRSGGVHPVDRQVGQHLRLARLTQGMSQGDLAKSVGLTFQQIQKYEKGSNRVSASKLFEFAKTLKVEVSYFFEGAAEGETVIAEDRVIDDTKIGRVDLAIAKALAAIENSALKRKLLELIVALTPGGPDPVM